MYRKPNILTKINVRRPEWAGHVLRTSDDTTVKKVFLGKPGKRKAGRPRLKWLDSTENGLTRWVSRDGGRT